MSTPEPHPPRARHQENCDVCRQIALIQSGDHPRFVAELPSGHVVMGPHQYWRGYCVLLCKELATELSQLSTETRAQFLEDLARMATAVETVCAPYKLNYEALGNQCHHLHWHVFPRTLEEPGRLDPIWVADSDLLEANPFNPVLHDDLRLALARELG